MASLLLSQGLAEDRQVKLDSLKRLLPAEDSHRQVDVLNQLSSIYAPINFDSAILFSVQAQRIANVSKYNRGVAVARLYTGNAYYYKMDLKNALLSYLAALNILEEFNPSKELGELYMQLGNINYYMGRIDKAIAYFRQAGDIYRATGNFRESLQEPYAISFTYLMHNQLDSALYYSKIYVSECRKLDDRRLEAQGLNVMGWICSAMKNPILRQKADSCNYKSLEIGKALNDQTIIAINFLNMGNNLDKGDFHFQGALVDFQQAREYYLEAMRSAKKAGLYLLQGAISNYLAGIEIEEKKFEDARRSLQMAGKYLDTLFHFPVKHISIGPYPMFGKMVDFILAQQQRICMYDLCFKLAMAEGETSMAIDFLRLYYQHSDSLYSQQQSRQFELLMTEAEAEKTDQKIRSLAQENELNQLRAVRARFISAGIAAMVVIISLFVLLFFQRKRLKAEQKSISMEQRLLRAQMNPHFLFNSLASIQNYIINEESDKASIYLSRFSQLVRNILDNSVEEYVPLEKEVETIQNYLELQKVRYAGKFDYTIDIDIDADIAMIPPMLAQPFIENAIEHGIRHKAGPGQIDIRFQLEGGFIRFEVEDDGVGRERAREIEATQGRKHRSMATSITVDRLEAINRKQKKKIRLEIEDLKDSSGEACGTRVWFGIPVIAPSPALPQSGEGGR
jgi:tetratricopeptide (TPR) repeat protein